MDIVSQEIFTQSTWEALPPRKSHLNCSSHSPETEVAASHCPWGLETGLPLRREVHSVGLHNGPHMLKGLPTTPGPATVPYG